MPLNIAVAVIVNLGLLLLLSWLFFVIILSKYRTRIQHLKKKYKKSNNNTANEEENPFSELIQNNKNQQQSVDKINQFLDEFDDDDTRISELQEEVGYLESQLHDSLKIINRQASLVADENTLNQADNDQSFTVNSLRHKVNSLRNENASLHEKVEQITRHNQRLKRYRDEHRLLTERMAEYIDKTKKSDHLIKKLQSKLIATQTAAEEAQRALQRLQIPNADDDGESLQAALERAEREREFLEQQYLELLKQLEEAEGVSEELQRSQAECAQLEQAYMALVEEIQEVEKNQIETEEITGFDEEKTEPSQPKSDKIDAPKELTEEEIREKNEQWLESLNDPSGR